MSSSSDEKKATAANAELDKRPIDKRPTDKRTEPSPSSTEPVEAVKPCPSSLSQPLESTTKSREDQATPPELSPKFRTIAGPVGELKVPIDFDLDDFDDDFDDDFEAEISGEYELQDDEYVRALLDIVDFEIEGLEAYQDDNE